MAVSYTEPPEALLPVPQNVMGEFHIHTEDHNLPDFCDIKRKSGVTNRRKSRRSMNFTPEKVFLLSASESPTEPNCNALHQECIREDQQFEDAPVLFDNPVNNKDVDRTALLSQDADSTALLPLDVDSTALLSQDADSTALLSQDVDSTALLSLAVDSTALFAQGVDSTALLPQDIDSTALLPLDVDSTALSDKPVDRKKARRRRRSADFDIIQNIQAHLSPDIEIEGLDEVQKLPGSRKSRRLKRQSMELCKAVVMRIPSECDSPLSQSPSPSVSSSPVTTPVTRQEPLQYHSYWDTQDQSTSIETGGEHTPDSQNTNTQTTTKTAANRGKQKVNKKGRKAKKCPEPNLEDIYKNRLWRSQMPKEASWETIYEEPHFSKAGKTELCGTKKFRRVLNYDEFFNKQKLKRRRQKAKALGFKPMSAKRKTVVGAALDLRLQDLDTYCQLVQNKDIALSVDQSASGAETLKGGCVNDEKNNNVEETGGITEIASATSHIYNTEHDNKTDCVSPTTSCTQQPEICAEIYVTEQYKNCPDLSKFTFNQCI